MTELEEDVAYGAGSKEYWRDRALEAEGANRRLAEEPANKRLEEMRCDNLLLKIEKKRLERANKVLADAMTWCQGYFEAVEAYAETASARTSAKNARRKAIEQTLLNVSMILHEPVDAPANKEPANKGGDDE